MYQPKQRGQQSPVGAASGRPAPTHVMTREHYERLAREVAGRK